MRISFSQSSRIALRLAWIGGLLVTAWFSLLPATRLGDVPGWDKHWHFGGYLLLALPLTFLFPSRKGSARAAGALVACGLLLEVGQHFVPGRSTEAADLIANSLGVVAGLLLSTAIRSLATHRGAIATGD